MQIYFVPTPSSVRFHDDGVRKDFSKNFCKRGIHLERHAIQSDFSDTSLPTVIHSRGCGSLCPSVIIREFYSNMHGINTLVPHFFSCVQGMRIVVTLEIVFKVLHVPRVAHPNYPSCECLRTMSKDKHLSHFYETPSSWGNRKTPLAQALQKVQDSLTWWWHSFFILCLTITPLQSLMLDFCCPF